MLDKFRERNTLQSRLGTLSGKIRDFVQSVQVPDYFLEAKVSELWMDVVDRIDNGPPEHKGLASVAKFDASFGTLANDIESLVVGAQTNLENGYNDEAYYHGMAIQLEPVIEKMQELNSALISDTVKVDHVITQWDKGFAVIKAFSSTQGT